MTRRSPVTLLIHIGRQCGRPVRIYCTALVQVPYNALSDVRAVRTFRKVAAIVAAAAVVAADAVAADAVVAANTGRAVAVRAVVVVVIAVVAAAAAAAVASVVAVVVVVVTADTAVAEAVVAVASNATAAGDVVCLRTCHLVAQAPNHDHFCRCLDLPIPLADLSGCS